MRGRVQSSVARIAKGAPDFETLAESLEWQGPAPTTSKKVALYKPVRSAPGWAMFKRGFFVRADAIICVPERYSALQVETSHKGRVRVLINDEKLIDDVRPLPATDLVRGAAATYFQIVPMAVRALFLLPKT